MMRRIKRDSQEAHGPQGSYDDESPTISVHDVQDFEPNMIDYEADTAEEAQESS